MLLRLHSALQHFRSDGQCGWDLSEQNSGRLETKSSFEFPPYTLLFLLAKFCGRMGSGSDVVPCPQGYSTATPCRAQPRLAQLRSATPRRTAPALARHTAPGPHVMDCRAEDSVRREQGVRRMEDLALSIGPSHVQG